MSDKEYLAADNEVFSMVNNREPGSLPQVGVIIPLSKVQEVNEMDTRIRKAKQIGAASVRAGIGLVFIAGMVRGLMDPMFAVAAALVCVGWGIATYRRTSHG